MSYDAEIYEPADVNGQWGTPIEAAADLLGQAKPKRADFVPKWRKGPAFRMSPGSVTKRLYFFLAPYAEAQA
jgi:hypothetical protein